MGVVEDKIKDLREREKKVLQMGGEKAVAKHKEKGKLTARERLNILFDAVSEGKTVVVLEAMKMENALPAPVGSTIKAVNFASGDSVQKNDVLAVIG
ncbi:MAG: biotin/lipoyl-containing protein [Desulfobacterales bacterium]